MFLFVLFCVLLCFCWVCNCYVSSCQKDLLADFLEARGLPLKAAIVRNFPAKRLQMSWRDTMNTKDCGVFTMRHMESYVGQSVKNWDCGLRRGDPSQLKQLRRKYLHAISTSEFNTHRDSNIMRAVAFVEQLTSVRE